MASDVPIRSADFQPVIAVTSTVDYTSIKMATAIPIASANTNALTVAVVDSSGNQITSFGGSGGTAQNDNTAFTAGTTSMTPVGAFYHSTIDAVTDGRAAALAIDSKRNLFNVIRDAAGNARGANVTASNELLVNVNNASIAITAASLPLPTGASTAAKQPALGTAGAASADVITVQGIASMTKLLVTADPITFASAQHIIADSGTITTVSAVTAITNALPAGTNNIGLVTPTPTSNSGWSFNYQSALSSTKAQIKGSAGTFGGYINLYNPNTAVTFIQVFNKASANVTVGTTAPDFVITLPGIATASGTGSDRNLEITCGLAMSTGITIAATTSASGSSAPANAIVGTFLFL